MRRVVRYSISIITALIATSLAVWGYVLITNRWGTPPALSDEVRDQIPRATRILDSDGKELYRFFTYNRIQTPFESISPWIVDAIIATEDQTFWDNNGYDLRAITRAAISNRQGNNTQGGSTITQQLIKNFYLSSEQSYRRKIHEVYLARQLTSERNQQYATDYAAKASILADYLNYIYLGNHSYGIHTAAENYFRTTPDQLTLSQSAILASLPQSPSRYDPHRYPSIVLGSWTYDNTVIPATALSGSYHIQTISQTPLTIQHSESCLSDIAKRASVNSYIYSTGRKDRVLCRMYTLGYITTQQLHDALIEGYTNTIFSTRTDIRAPHFVFMVEQFVSQHPPLAQLLGDRELSTMGRDIYTSLDMQTHNHALATLSNHMDVAHEEGANNRSLLHIDPRTGDIISYVGSVDYYDTSIAGQNDMIRSLRQVGSTIKPLIVGYAMMRDDYNPSTIVDDLPIPPSISPGHQPSNADNMYRGPITLAKSLAGSRNTPIVRLFFALGGESILVDFLRKTGFVNLRDNASYGYSLALGSGEGSMRQLAQSYITLANHTDDYISHINPVLHITDSNQQYIYTKIADTASISPRAISIAAAQDVWSILSDLRNAPTNRTYHLSIPARETGSYASKSGTSEKKIASKSYPNDARLITYRPDAIIISRAGHTQGRALGEDGYGLHMNHDVIKDYVRGL